MGASSEQIVLQYLKERGGYARLSEFTQQGVLKQLLEKELIRVVRKCQSLDQPQTWLVELI